MANSGKFCQETKQEKGSEVSAGVGAREVTSHLSKTRSCQTLVLDLGRFVSPSTLDIW